MSLNRQRKWYIGAALMFLLIQHGIACGPGRLNIQRKRERVPFKLRQRVPDVHETSVKASGSSNRIKRGTAAYDELQVNINPNIVFKADRGTNDHRRMTKRCERKLDNLAILVRDYWHGKVKIKVIRAYDDGTVKLKHRRKYPYPDLHYAGRAVDITTNDADSRERNPMLARLAYEAGFDWVSYESKAFIHASVQSEESGTDDGSGCFHSNSTVQLQNGTRIQMKDLKIGDKVASIDSNGQITYSSVIMFFHRSRKRRTTFQIIRTHNHPLSLAITPTHFIYKLNKQTQRDIVDYAKWLSVGDEIYVRNSLETNGPLSAQRVTEINRVEMLSAFAPLTETGTIIVDDIAVSCYAVFPSEVMSHWSMLPVRMVAKFYPNFFETDEEIHWYPKALFKLYQLFKR